MIKISENLQLLRREKGITQEEFANIMGVTAQSVSKWELGLSCPDIALLPEIAEYYKISIDELLGYKPLTSMDSVYLKIKEYVSTITNDDEKYHILYRLARILGVTFWKQKSTRISDSQEEEIRSLLKDVKPRNISYSQNQNGIFINGDHELFFASFKDYPKYDLTKIKKVYRHLRKLANINTLKVLFALFYLMIENDVRDSFTINEISEKCGLEAIDVFDALNDLDIEYGDNNTEKYSLRSFEQVPLLIMMLISNLEVE